MSCLHAKLFFVLCLSASALAQFVTLDNATFFGTTLGLVTRYLGIPYAEPPTGDRRFRLPVAKNYPSGTFLAVVFGPSCPQQAVRLPNPGGVPAKTINAIIDSIYRTVLPDSEDCLTVNVVKPALILAGSKLPVVVWIHGGSFELGSTSTYDGGAIVQRSILMGQPVIYVSMNYRLSLFGFLASKEVKAEGVGNLGLQDQRLALRWVQKYIDKFGGDPSKVTIWGQSAGSISVSLHMLTNGGNTEGLFRAAFMQSGFPFPVGDITNGQPYYDAIVSGTGCSSAPDTLACLRAADYETLLRLMNESQNIFSYQSLHLAWLPRTDGVFLKETPQKLVASGGVAKIPIIVGHCDDEGTLFSFSNLNITTEDQLWQYMKTVYAVGATDAEITRILQLYPADITQGSPYDTSILNALTPQFKRLASLQGDIFIQGPRRYFINNLQGQQDIWVYSYKRHKLLPFLGASHGSDIANIYGIGEIGGYLINFATNLDPNGFCLFSWPTWNLQTRSMLTFLGGFKLIPKTILPDTFREDPINFIIQLALKYPI
ncbi:carotenoid ester lipase precursor [Gautieria morchelliformis]|nr:carotenoid ester lipase precursor [Gautieria morchelliformis]